VLHFRRPQERPFTADQRDQTTILFGGLTTTHDTLIESVFDSCGYRCQRLPTADLAAFHRGRQYCNTGQCNPTYFSVGSLLGALDQLEASGMSRAAIIDRYVLFTAGACGPCRFGMYEAEFRLALQNAGFDGFRVLLFQQDQGVKASSGAPGLKFSLDFGLGALNALNIADALQDVAYRIRPYEVRPGETDRVVAECLRDLADGLRAARPAEPIESAPRWLSRLARPRRGVPGAASAPARRWLHNTINLLGKMRFHLYGREHGALLARCAERIDRIEVDRLRVKPMVKITGEFWAQTTEGDGNYRMFAFLEREGAQVLVEPVGTWVLYLLYHAKEQARARKGLRLPYPEARWWRLGQRWSNAWSFRKRWLLLSVAERFYARQFHRVAQALGGLTEDLASQRELATLARPFYHPLSRGGEGHLEVAKNVYYTVTRRCHMVLSLKPFGCMPSTQSDGVQSAVVNQFPDMIFTPIETSGEGEVNAHSRAQMALSDAKARAREEFDAALKASGKRAADIQAYVAAHPMLRRPFYRVPRTPGSAGVAANFARHVSNLIDAGPDPCHVPRLTP
jgi:predicted nucleotide-binding protein (sugar kinase/HSP70/actin superfamily)